MPSVPFVTDLLDHAVVDRDDRGVLTGVDVDPASGRGRVDDVGGVARGRAFRLRRARRLALGDVVGVAGLRGDGEAVALGEAGERADEIVRELAVLAGVQEHLVDVPVGVVVGEDPAAKVRVAPRGLEVAGSGADRVDGVVGVLAPVVVRVHSVALPGRGDELHPAERAGRGDVEVGPERGLDPVDPGEHLPRDPVLGAAGLVDREQERRDLELVDHEVRDPDGGGPEVGDAEGRVRLRRGAVRAPNRRLGDLLALLAGTCAAGAVVAASVVSTSAVIPAAAVVSAATALVRVRVARDVTAGLGLACWGRRELGLAVGIARALRVVEVDQAVAVVIDLVRALRALLGGEPVGDLGKAVVAREADAYLAGADSEQRRSTGAGPGDGYRREHPECER